MGGFSSTNRIIVRHALSKAGKPNMFRHWSTHRILARPLRGEVFWMIFIN